MTLPFVGITQIRFMGYSLYAISATKGPPSYMPSII